MENQESNYLEHHGILGQKWGIRRFQNKDGTRTPAGKKREKYKTVAEEAREVLRNRDQYSDKELQAKVNRLNNAARLRDIAGSENYKKGKSLLDKYTTAAQKITLAATSTAALIAVGKKAMNSDYMQKVKQTWDSL